MKINENHKFLNRKLKSIRGYQIISAIMFGINGILTGTLIVQMQQLLDAVSAGNGYSNQQMMVFAILLALFFINGVCSQFFFRQLPYVAKNKLLGEFYQILASHDVAYFSTHPQGVISSVMQNDIVQYATIMSSFSVIVFGQLVSLCINGFLMMRYSLELSLILFALIALCFLSTSFISKHLAKINQSIFQKKGVCSEMILELLGNIRTIKILQKESTFSKRFSSFLMESLYPKERKEGVFYAFYIGIYQLLAVSIPLLTIALGIYLVAQHSLTIGAVIALYSLVIQLQEPIRVLAENVNQRKSMIKLADRIMDTLYQEEKENRNVTIEGVDCIEFQMKQFPYGDKSLLKNVNFTLTRNDKIMVYGESGCGKSTMLSIIMQFLNHEDNTILFDGLESNTIIKQDIYHNILMVDQNHVLFSESIKENITLFEEFDDNLFEEVIQVCQLQELINERKGEMLNGQHWNISGGQAQRICIARMLIRKPSFLLMDEPTSALDENTSIAFLQALKLYADKYHIGLLIISHKEDVKQICNRMLEVRA